MTENERDKVIERVRKLLALSANNPSENEAASAAAKAQQILIEHNLSIAEVKDHETAEEEDFEIVPVANTPSAPWRRFLGAAVGELYFCKYFYTTTYVPGKQAKRDVHTFVGAKHNIAVATLMFVYLHKTVSRLARTGATANPQSNVSAYVTTFRASATIRLCQRIKEKITAAKSGTLKSTTGANLPACLDMYEHAAAKAQSTLAAMGTAITTKKVKLSNLDGRAWNDGFNAANEIGLEAQVGQSKQKRIGA